MIISENWVLTAAHCLAGETSVSVIAGQWNVAQTSGNEQRRTASNVIMHPQYNSNTYEYDFGLLELDTPFTFNSCVGAIALPTADASAGESCWIPRSTSSATSGAWMTSTTDKARSPTACCVR